MPVMNPVEAKYGLKGHDELSVASIIALLNAGKLEALEDVAELPWFIDALPELQALPPPAKFSMFYKPHYVITEVCRAYLQSAYEMYRVSCAANGVTFWDHSGPAPACPTHVEPTESLLFHGQLMPVQLSGTIAQNKSYAYETVGELCNPTCQLSHECYQSYIDSTTENYAAQLAAPANGAAAASIEEISTADLSAYIFDTIVTPNCIYSATGYAPIPNPYVEHDVSSSASALIKHKRGGILAEILPAVTPVDGITSGHLFSTLLFDRAPVTTAIGAAFAGKTLKNNLPNTVVNGFGGVSVADGSEDLGEKWADEVDAVDRRRVIRQLISLGEFNGSDPDPYAYSVTTGNRAYPSERRDLFLHSVSMAAQLGSFSMFVLLRGKPITHTSPSNSYNSIYSCSVAAAAYCQDLQSVPELNFGGLPEQPATDSYENRDLAFEAAIVAAVNGQPLNIPANDTLKTDALLFIHGRNDVRPIRSCRVYRGYSSYIFVFIVGVSDNAGTHVTNDPLVSELPVPALFYAAPAPRVLRARLIAYGGEVVYESTMSSSDVLENVPYDDDDEPPRFAVGAGNISFSGSASGTSIVTGGIGASIGIIRDSVSKELMTEDALMSELLPAGIIATGSSPFSPCSGELAAIRELVARVPLSNYVITDATLISSTSYTPTVEYNANLTRFLYDPTVWAESRFYYDYDCLLSIEQDCSPGIPQVYADKCTPSYTSVSHLLQVSHYVVPLAAAFPSVYTVPPPAGYVWKQSGGGGGLTKDDLMPAVTYRGGQGNSNGTSLCCDDCDGSSPKEVTTYLPYKLEPRSLAYNYSVGYVVQTAMDCYYIQEGFNSCGQLGGCCEPTLIVPNVPLTLLSGNTIAVTVGGVSGFYLGPAVQQLFGGDRARTVSEDGPLAMVSYDGTAVALRATAEFLGTFKTQVTSGSTCAEITESATEDCTPTNGACAADYYNASLTQIQVLDPSNYNSQYSQTASGGGWLGYCPYIAVQNCSGHARSTTQEYSFPVTRPNTVRSVTHAVVSPTYGSYPGGWLQPEITACKSSCTGCGGSSYQRTDSAACFGVLYIAPLNRFTLGSGYIADSSEGLFAPAEAALLSVVSTLSGPQEYIQ